MDAFRVLDPAQQRGGVGVERREIGSVYAAPVVQQQRGVWISVRHLDRTVETEVPFAVGEVEQHGIGGRHVQVMVGDEPWIARSPDGAVRRVDPEPATVDRKSTRLN